jgi:polyhydroxybutyrate depolymerase
MRSALLLATLLAACTDGSSASTTTESTGGSSGMSEGTGSSGNPTTGATGPSSTGEASGASTGTATGDASASDASTAGSTGEATTGEPLGGCGKDPGAVDGSPQVMMVEGADRQYILAVPPGYDPNKQYPLVFAWHGRGGSGALARLYFKVEEASQGQAIFVYPYGLPLADMQNQTGWDLDPANEDFAFFDALLADLNGRLCIDQGRIFSTGHSFGGYMSNQIGCLRGDVIRAIGLVAGGGPYGVCSGQVAAWLAHGTVDEVVPYAEGVSSHEHWSAANHCTGPGPAVDPAPCVADDGCDADSPVVWCSHSEPDLNGHGWPNWAGAGIWAFFASLG